MNKKTFYRYYETMDFLLAEFQEDMMSAYLKRVEGLSIPEDLDRITREFFAFAAERGKVFERITCAGPHGALQAQMESGVLERHGSDSGALDPERSLLMSYVTASTLAIYRQWVADGKRIPSNQVADLASNLICRGTEGSSIISQ